MEEVLSLLEAKKLFLFLDEFLGGKSVATKYKWLRAVNYGKFTGSYPIVPTDNPSGVHMDRVYMGQGSSKLCTGRISQYFSIFASLATFRGHHCRTRHLDGFSGLPSLHSIINFEEYLWPNWR
jgi:hypothetical protein